MQHSHRISQIAKILLLLLKDSCDTASRHAWHENNMPHKPKSSSKHLLNSPSSSSRKTNMVV
jgi:hypothetical protein